MRKSKKQIRLERELRLEKRHTHNKCMKANAIDFRKQFIVGATRAEKCLLKVLSNSHYNDLFEFQHIIYVKKNRNIEKFYIADFCFPHKKAIIELDGGYHFTKEQIIKDRERETVLKTLGYRVYRFNNSRILSTKDFTGFLSELSKLIL